MALAACGNDDDSDDPAGNGDDNANGGSVSGTFTIEGSSTVQPFTIEAIEAFRAVYPDITINPPSGLGSGGGITAFINGDVEVAQASREIKDDEVAQAENAGREAFETTIFRDALAIVVHPDNPIDGLTVEQVAQIFAGEITDWSEVGGQGGEITVYTRNEESGTFAYMEEDVIQATLGDDAEYASTVNKQANAPSGLEAVSRDQSGIFYAGLGNLADIPEGSVKVVPVAAEGGDAVEPNAETVASGDYPIARGLYYYTDGDPAEHENEAVATFIAWVLSDEGQEIGVNLGFLSVN